MAMRRLMALLLVLMLGFTLILSGCSSSPSELTRVRLCEVTHSIFYAPQYVALHQGFLRTWVWKSSFPTVRELTRS